MDILNVSTDTPVSENKLKLMAIIARCQNEKYIEDITRALMLQQAMDEKTVRCSA